MALITLLILVVFLMRACDDGVHATMEGMVVGGDYVNIAYYPHSAFLAVSCVHYNKVSNWICGASIVNQQFTLTAGHCLEDCLKHSTVSISYGSEVRGLGLKSTAQAIRIHEKYDSGTMIADIAIVRLHTRVWFGATVKRVAISRNPPYNENAYVAGWGVVDEKTGVGTRKLKHVRQTLWTRNECSKVLRNLPVGSICAGAKNAQTNFAASGDSGSALIVRGFIQVGIVSYKMPKTSNSLAVYTEVKFYYDWIMQTTTQLYCGGTEI